MSKRLTFEYAEEFFKEQGCELLEKEYINCRTLMRYICNCGRINKTNFSNFQTGKRCRKCGSKRSGEKRKYTFEYVYICFKEEGCELLEKEYINNRTKMKYICSCGNISEITFNSFKNGNRCRKCSGSEKHTLEYVKQYFKDNNCELLEKKYIDNKKLMNYRCECNRISKISFTKFKSGQRCHWCGHEKTKGKNNGNYNHSLTDEERFIKRNYPKYLIWRTNTYIRDDYTCQKCFARGGILNAHHIEGYAENKDLRTDDDNGITFCECCHKKFHKIYGIKNNNRQQLEEFLKISLSIIIF